MPASREIQALSDGYLTALSEHWREQTMPVEVDLFFETPGTLPEKLLALARYITEANASGTTWRFESSARSTSARRRPSRA